MVKIGPFRAFEADKKAGKSYSKVFRVILTGLYRHFAGIEQQKQYQKGKK